MINWDFIKGMGVLYIILALMILGISFSISMISNLLIDNVFWGCCLAASSIYWGITFFTAVFEN
ncbi:MAG: hypothetical protein E6356_14105 [Terrisporobacter othiniensis]|nr:hypothetical protein [Terrisporobacter othiniensis]